MPTYARSLTDDQYDQFRTALPKYCASTVLTIGGQSYTAAALEALITGVLGARAAVPVAKAAWLEAIAKIAALEASDGNTIKQAREVVAVMLKHDPVALTELGIEPKAPRAPLSTHARALATEKLRATRKVRQTRSKKQKAKIKGNVTGVTIAPVVTTDPAEAGETEDPSLPR